MLVNSGTASESTVESVPKSSEPPKPQRLPSGKCSRKRETMRQERLRKAEAVIGEREMSVKMWNELPVSQMDFRKEQLADSNLHAAFEQVY